MKKILLVLVLIFILLGTSQKVISFFEEETEVILHENNSLYQLKVTTREDSNRLIPRTALLGVDETHEIIYKYEIYVEDNVDLLSEIKDLQILDSSLKAQKINDLFDFEIPFFFDVFCFIFRSKEKLYVNLINYKYRGGLIEI